MNNKAQIPEQEQGAQKDFEHQVTFTSLSTAKNNFDVAKYRLLEINQWHEYAGVLSADFLLTNKNGEQLDRPANVGDYIKIDVPGPNHPGGRYDWVRIEEITYEMPDARNEMLFLKLVPCAEPGVNEEKDASHFFDENSSSSFILKREEQEITISYHGSNEIVNTHTGDALDNARNWLIGLSAMLGFSDIQWKKLIQGIVEVQE